MYNISDLFKKGISLKYGKTNWELIYIKIVI